jgi:hypothetical protein
VKNGKSFLHINNVFNWYFENIAKHCMGRFWWSAVNWNNIFFSGMLNLENGSIFGFFLDVVAGKIADSIWLSSTHQPTKMQITTSVLATLVLWVYDCLLTKLMCILKVTLDKHTRA